MYVESITKGHEETVTVKIIMSRTFQDADQNNIARNYHNKIKTNNFIWRRQNRYNVRKKLVQIILIYTTSNTCILKNQASSKHYS